MASLRTEFIPQIGFKDRVYKPDWDKRRAIIAKLHPWKADFISLFRSDDDCREIETIDPPASGKLLSKFVEQTFEHDPSEAAYVLECITSQMDLVNINHYKGMLFPFIEMVTPLIEREDTEALETPYGNLVRKLLPSYLRRYAEAQPTQPKDYRRPRGGCGCSNCRALDDFVTNPKRKVGRFPVNNNQRAHLHNMCVRSPDLIHKTERRGSPYTLVVTKTTRDYEMEKAAWQDRRGEAKEQLHKLGELVDLPALLGDQYESIVEHLLPIACSSQKETDTGTFPKSAPSGVSARVSGEGALALASGNAQITARGVKRKAETDVVDLTVDH